MCLPLAGEYLIELALHRKPTPQSRDLSITSSSSSQVFSLSATRLLKLFI